MTDEQVFAVKDPPVRGYDPAVPQSSEPRTDAPARGPSAERSPIVRYRCTACGNLTRFDVTTLRRSRAFHHFTVGGDLDVEEVEVLDEEVESVVCHWCGTGDSVVELDPGDVPGDVPGDLPGDVTG